MKGSSYSLPKCAVGLDSIQLTIYGPVFGTDTERYRCERKCSQNLASFMKLSQRKD
jgi:hypothetical protein